MPSRAWTRRCTAIRRTQGLAIAVAMLVFHCGVSRGNDVETLPGPHTGSDGNLATINAATGLPATLAAGRTPGTFAVSHSGAAIYRIPLWTPPGIGALELNLALTYSSRSGNGPLGLGWSLDGLSNISRCNRTWAQDGVASGVGNASTDRFCLDGRQLKLVSGTYGSAGSVYATEVETYSRIVANGAAGAGPATFTVTSKNGLVYEYGSTVDSRLYAGASGSVRTWALSRIRDRAGPSTGNSIALTYANDAQPGVYTNGSHRVSSISYPTTTTGMGPFYQVNFDYSLRPASDVPAGYLAGNVVREPYQLDTIRISSVASAEPIKRYNLGYASGPATGRLRLTSVQECSASSCLRPTTVTYQDGAVGWQGLADTGIATASNKNPIPLDLNGDGLGDLFYPADAGNGNLSWRILLGSTSGFSAPIETGIVTSTSSRAIPGNFAGNGRTQVLVPQNGYWHVAGYTNTGFVVVNTGLPVVSERAAGDFDGDGLTDLVAQTNSLTPTFSIRRNVSSPSSGNLNVQFAPEALTVWTVGGLRQAMGDGVRIADFNGDGRTDLVVLSFTSSLRNPKFFATPLLSNGFSSAFTVGTEKLIWQESMVTIGDWNADGCSDILQPQAVYVSNCAGGLVEIATAATPATGSSVYTALPADWNGDGRTDLLYVDAATKQWYVVPSTGAGAAAPANTGIPAPASTAWFTMDSDGDGLTDLAYRDGGNGNRIRYRTHALPGISPDLATGFLDSFGMRQSPTYVSIARSHHARQNDAVFPEADFQAPLYVVNQFTATDGSGVQYSNQLTYAGARIHLQGRGFLGFRTQRIQDSRSGLVTVDEVQRSFPFTGMHTQRSVFQANGTTRLRLWSATVASRTAGGAGNEQRVFPYVASDTELQYEASGPLLGTVVTESIRSYGYGDGYGNATQVQASTTDKDPYSPFLNSTWQTNGSYSYVNDATGNWCVGLPATSVVTRTAPGQAPMTRTHAFSVDPLACRITQQVMEPGNPSLKVTSAFGFDACGNLNSLRVTGSSPEGTALPVRTTSFDYGSRCQLPESATNALGQVRTFAHRYDFGLPTRSTDPNGLATTWSYDDFGRMTLETRPDGTRASLGYESCSAGPCWGNNDFRFLVHATRLAGDGSVIRQSQSYYDGSERPRSQQFTRVLGTWTRVDLTYDALGRLVSQTRPYSTVGNGLTRRTYDVRGRVISERETDSSGAIVRSSTASYSGRTATLTDPLGRSRQHVVDVTGRLRRLIDPLPGGTTRFDFDSLGNLARIQDAVGAVSSGINNARGFRTQWSDPDAGTWQYRTNSLNELVGWTDAKRVSFSAAYDLLGRRVSRTTPEGTSLWTWGASSSSRNVDRLQGKSGLGYSELFAYDSLGRLASRVITTDQSYRYDYAYNAAGDLDTLTYPASPVPAGQASDRFKIRIGYSFGEPQRIDDVTGPSPKPLWTLTAANDSGTPVAETLGTEAIRLLSTRDATTNLLTSLQAGAGGTANNRQNLAYQWDANGNLVQRRDVSQNLIESFSYDGLDRLTGSVLNGVPNLAVAYDASGNITHKSDVGTYGFGDPARRHAATSAGGETLGYDANGNVVTRNGLSQRWASFNLPTLLQKSGYEARFAYGPDHQRWRQVATYQNGTETTHYAAKLLEKESTSSTGLTYWRHYVPTPGGTIAVVSRNSDGSSSTSYALADHLGSRDLLVDHSGTARARLSFAAYGARRGSNWTSGTAPEWAPIANTTRQGFTSHEMLDNVGYVHMGGRVYDPTLGRFLSVDPVIGDLGDSQSLNAYAYAGNRPLSFIDPTGLAFVYVPDGACGGICASIVASVATTVINLLTHGSSPPPPPATALPGQSAQHGASLCGPGTFSPTCGGTILYAGSPPVVGGAGTSTWTQSTDPYAAENLDQFFADLGVNAVDVLILAPARDAKSAYDSAREGDYSDAAVYLAFTLCETAKPCYALKGPLRGLSRVASALGNKVPSEVARVVAGNRKLTTLGRPDAQDVFVVDADDIRGLNADELAERLTIPGSDVFTVIRFPTPKSGLASPVFRSNPGFIPGGLTRGGAREYVVPNGPIPPGAKVETIVR